MTQAKRNLTGEQSALDEQTADVRHRLLAAKRRRMTLDILTGVTCTVELSELAAGVVARESGMNAVDDDTVLDVMVTLHHVHLPMMATFGVIDYDPHSKRIQSRLTRSDAPSV